MRRAERGAEQLMTETDPEDRDRRRETAAPRRRGGRARRDHPARSTGRHRRVGARAPRPVASPPERPRRRRSSRAGRGSTASRRSRRRRPARARPRPVGRGRGHLGDEVLALGAGFGDGRREQLGPLGGPEGARHRARLAHMPRQPPGVDTGEPADAVSAQERLELPAAPASCSAGPSGRAARRHGRTGAGPRRRPR